MKKIKYIAILFLIGLQLHSQTTIVNKLVARGLVKQNSATRILVQDSITKNFNWILKSSLMPSKQYVNEIIEETGFVLTGQNLTINPDWKWIINEVLYTNLIANNINAIPLASTGNSRIDIIVCNTSNEFVRIQGTESSTTPYAPAIPLNTLQATFFVVTDLAVEEPAPVISSNLYIPKSEKTPLTINNTGALTVVSIGKFPTQHSLVLTGTITSVGSIYFATNRGQYLGRKLAIKNGQTTNITLNHNLSTLGHPFFFPNELDFVLKPNETVEFLYNAAGKYDYVGVFDKDYAWIKSGANIYASNLGNVWFDNAGFGTGYNYTTKSIQGTWLNGSFTYGSIGVTNGTDGVAMYLNSLEAFIYGGVGRDMNVGTLKPGGTIKYSFNNVIKSVLNNNGTTTTVATIADIEAGSDKTLVTKEYVKKITVRKISTATTLAESDNGTVIILTGSCTVTLPNGLSSGFNCSFATQAGATLTYTLGGSVTLINNSSLVMIPLSSHTLVNTGTANEYLTVGL